MVESNLDSNKLQSELNTIILTAARQAKSARKQVTSILRPVFDKQGYTYKIDPDRGNFSINIDEYSELVGEFKEENFRIHIRCKFDDTQAHSIGLFLSLRDFEQYVPVIDSIIKGTRELSLKLNEQSKALKGAELLSMSMVQPYLDKLKLKKAILIAPDDKIGEVIVRLPVFNNYYIQSRMSYDNYEQYCKDLSDATKYASSLFPTKVKKKLTFHRYPEFHNKLLEANKRQIIYLPRFHEGTYNDGWNLDNLKMKYANPEAIDDLIPDDKENPESEAVAAALDELGFYYNVTDDMLLVFINEEIVLTRDESSHKTLVQVYSKWGYYTYEALTFHDDEFILMLKLIAKYSTKDDELKAFKITYKECPNAMLSEIFEAFIPGNWLISYTPASSNIIDVVIDRKYWITIQITSGETVNVFWTLLNNQSALNNLPTLLSDKSHMEMYIEEDRSYITS